MTLTPAQHRALTLVALGRADARQLSEVVKIEIPALLQMGFIKLKADGWTVTTEGEAVLVAMGPKPINP